MSGIELSNSQSEQLYEWLFDIRDQECVGRWRAESVDVLDINYCGDLELRVYRFQNSFVAVATGGGQDREVDHYETVKDLSKWMAMQSQSGNREDGWEFDLKAFNKLPDLFQKLPSELRLKIDTGLKLAQLITTNFDFQTVLAFDE